MRAAVEPLEGNKVKVTVSVDEGEFDHDIDRAFKALAKEVRLPGFRPGKAPRRVLETRIGTEVGRQRALQDALPNYYMQAIRDENVDAVAQPEIEITAGEESGEVTFDAVVEIRPEIDVPGYGGLKITVDQPAASDDDIDEFVDRLRSNTATWEAADRAAADGDQVLIDIAAVHDGEPLDALCRDDYTYQVGFGQPLPELDEHLRGASAGDHVTFTAAYPGADDDEMPPIELEVDVREVRAKVLPEVTDEWAAEASEFATVDELRNDLGTRLTEMKRMQVARTVRDKLTDALAQLVDDDAVPESMVQNVMQNRLVDFANRLSAQGISVEQWMQATGTEPDALRAQLRDGSPDVVKVDLALRAVVRAQSLECTDDDLDAEIDHMALHARTKPAKVRQQLERNDNVQAVRSEVSKRKALDWLVEHCEIVDPDGQPIDRSLLADPDVHDHSDHSDHSDEDSAEGASPEEATE